MAVNRLIAIVVYAALVSRVSAEAPVDYTTQIKPLLAARCYACHSALRQQAGLRLDTGALAVAGGDSGAAIEPGQSGESLFVQMIAGELGTRMPPEDAGPALTGEEIALLKRWIDEGARAPEEPPPPGPAEHWAYRPPVRAEPPQVQDSSWVRNPIDAFLAAQHEARGLVPSEQATKEVLLRRIYLDLVGLPPTRDQLQAFLADDSPDAFEKVVDQLLASPQHGERWARHWMDVWRYSDWSGYKKEIRNSARHIWRWRDWIVESLNADQGYDQMVVEMLAGDEIAPTDPATLRATGFLVRNWYKFNRNTWLDSTIEHTSKAFLGITMNCARCHDHKFDPISHSDYYQMRAIFEPHDVRTDRVPGEADAMKDGLPRAVDATPAEPTYLFVRGDEKRPDKSQLLAPGMPAVMGVELKIEPVELPLSAYYPALAEFAIAEDLAKAAADVAAREKSAAESMGDAIPLATAQLAAARAAQASLIARIEADKAQHGLTPEADVAQLAAIAGKAEREFSLRQEQEQELTAQQEVAKAKQGLKPDDAATQKVVSDAEAKLIAAADAVAKAQAKFDEPATDYTPLGVEYPKTSTGRRLALARWIVNRKNPLAARVAVNHIWLRHFGTPLVESVFDFGLRAPAPRHQALLDWLSVELMEHDWQMKHVHRLIVTSTAYRMRSSGPAPSAANLAVDPDNHYLWRMNARRLEAEAVRDSVLHVAGSLDATLGGPDIPHAEGQTTPRRSLYFRHAYEKQMKFLTMFDGPSVNECYRRSESVVPQQALALANSELSLNQSRGLAKQLAEQSDSDERLVRLAFEQVLTRQPTAEELKQCCAFIASQTALLSQPNKLTPFTGGAKAAVAPASDPLQRARENLVHALLNHNDFVTIR